MNISVVHKSKDFLVINKPAGLLTHPTNRRDQSDSVVNWLLKKYPKLKDIQDKYGKSVGQWTDLRPGIVHRLDKETSGLMIVATTQSAFDYFKQLFTERKIKKTYLALVHGEMKNKSGRIELPLGKIGIRQTIRLQGKKMLKEKTAITEYRVISSFRSHQLPVTNYQLLEVSPLTGRTHQIRIHLKSIGHPIVCDQIYGGRKQFCPPELNRLFLHAQKLEFIAPGGEKIVLEADPPSELTDFLNFLTLAS